MAKPPVIVIRIVRFYLLAECLECHTLYHVAAEWKDRGHILGSLKCRRGCSYHWDMDPDSIYAEMEVVK